jgi:hypothetical protein
MKLPIICFNKKDLEEIEKKVFKNPNKGYSISLKKLEEEKVVIVDQIKELGDSPRYQCYPILPEDCSCCSKAESFICSRWWQGDFAEDRPEIDIDKEDKDWAYEGPVFENVNLLVDNYQEINLKLLQMKVWSKKNKSARTLAFIGAIQKDEHTYRCALVLAQLGYDSPDWAREVYNSDIVWMSEFLPEVVEIPSGRKEVQLFKKSLNKVLRDTKEIPLSVRGVWLAFIAGHLSEKWGFSQDILQSWLEKIISKL